VIFSVYDYDRGRYRYFEGIGGTPATGFFRKARQEPIQGAFVPEAFAVQIPAGAKQIGEGPIPKGYIAEDPQGLASTPVPGEGGQGGVSAKTPWLLIALVGVAAFAAGRASRARS